MRVASTASPAPGGSATPAPPSTSAPTPGPPRRRPRLRADAVDLRADAGGLRADARGLREPFIEPRRLREPFVEPFAHGHPGAVGSLGLRRRGRARLPVAGRPQAQLGAARSRRGKSHSAQATAAAETPTSTAASHGLASPARIAAGWK